MVTQTFTTGQIGMWGGTKDGKPAFADHVTKSSNVNPPTEVQITVEDARYAERKPTVKENGYELVRYPTAVPDEHFINWSEDSSKETIKDVYAKECAKLVQELSGASTVIPYDFKLRVQDKKITDPAKARSAAGGGLPIAHVDRDTESATHAFRHIVGDEEFERLSKTHKRWASINVWRPIGGTVEKWPLCMIDNRGVPDWSYDTHTGRVSIKNYHDNPSGPKPHDNIMKNSDNLRFQYVSNQTPDEAWVFAAFDSDPTKVAPHGAFWDDNSTDDAPPRRSFELRTFCLFDEVKDTP